MIFLLDSVIALFIVFIILAISIFFLSRSEQSPVSELQASRIANDVFAILDYRGLLGNFDANEITSELNAILPVGYVVEYKIECPNRVYDSRGSSTFSEESAFSGERVFVDTKFNKCIARYWVWLS
ncbi:MAG: hypothetical protein ABIB47_03215 [Candidatus Woesearchaeota archaeon]